MDFKDKVVLIVGASSGIGRIDLLVLNAGGAPANVLPKRLVVHILRRDVPPVPVQSCS